MYKHIYIYIYIYVHRAPSAGCPVSAAAVRRRQPEESSALTSLAKAIIRHYQ